MKRSNGVYDETSCHMIARVLKMSGQSLGIGVSGCSSTGARMRVHFRIKIRHALGTPLPCLGLRISEDRKSTRLNSSHEWISYAVFCLKKKKMEDVGQDFARIRQQACDVIRGATAGTVCAAPDRGGTRLVFMARFQHGIGESRWHHRDR